MASELSIDLAVPVLTAKYNNSTAYIDLTWEHPIVDETNILVPKYYVLGYREGNFVAGSPTDAEDLLDKYWLTYITAVDYPTTSYSWAPADDFLNHWSFGIYPVYTLEENNFNNGRIKLLTYTKSESVDVPLKLSSGITKDNDTDKNIYVRNGFKTSNAVAEISVISKVNSSGEFSNVSTDATQTVKGFTYSASSDIIFNSFDNTFYSNEDNRFYTKTSINGDLVSVVKDIYDSPGAQIPWTNWTFADGIGNIYQHWTSYGLIGSGDMSCIFKMLPNITDPWIKKVLPAGSWTLTELSTVAGLKKYKITTTNTSDLEVKQRIAASNFDYVNPGFITDVVPNESFTFVCKNTVTWGAGVGFTLYSFPQLLVAGNLYGSKTSLQTFTSDWFNTNVGVFASKGFVLGEHYYYMHKAEDDVKSFVKINLNTGIPTYIGTNTTNDYVAAVYNEFNFNVYAATKNALYLKNPFTNETVLVAGNETDSNNTDGVGEAARFNNIIDIESIEGSIIILEEKKVPSGDPLYKTNLIRIFDITTKNVTTASLAQAQPTEVKDEDAGNGDISIPLGTCGGIGDWSVCVPDVPTVPPSVTPPPSSTDPSPPPVIPVLGANPNTVYTFRKSGDRFYLLQDGVIIWTYLLTPIQMLNFPKNPYIGWFETGTTTPKETPAEYIKLPTYNATYYVLNAVDTEAAYSSQRLFDGMNYKIGNALVIYSDSSLYITRSPTIDDQRESEYYIESGRNYKIFNNTIQPSPILPRWVIDLIIENGFGYYLKEVE